MSKVIGNIASMYGSITIIRAIEDSAAFFFKFTKDNIEYCSGWIRLYGIMDLSNEDIINGVEFGYGYITCGWKHKEFTMKWTYDKFKEFQTNLTNIQSFEEFDSTKHCKGGWHLV